MNTQAFSDRERLSDSIRREMGNGMTTRFARSLDFFQTVDALPDSMRDLLARLDGADCPLGTGRRGH